MAAARFVRGMQVGKKTKSHIRQQEDEMSDQAIEVREEVRLGGLQVRGPHDVISQASSIASELMQIVEERKLYSIISGKKFPRVEAWTTMGAMLGITPREVETIKHEDGTFEAIVELIRNSDGFVVGRGSAICGMDEKTWKSRPAFARRSMSITRATGKAFRLSFSWIMTLAGYEPTPAEEMTPDVVEGKIVEPMTDGNGNDNDTDEIYQAVVDAKLSENIHAAKKTLAKCKTGYSDTGMAIAWMTLYRGWRDMGGTVAQAAKQANNGEVPK